jgi:hypothetical protein
LGDPRSTLHAELSDAADLSLEAQHYEHPAWGSDDAGRSLDSTMAFLKWKRVCGLLSAVRGISLPGFYSKCKHLEGGNGGCAMRSPPFLSISTHVRGSHLFGPPPFSSAPPQTFEVIDSDCCRPEPGELLPTIWLATCVRQSACVGVGADAPCSNTDLL